MKRFLLVIFSLWIVSTNAQMKEGRIVYERTFQLPMRFFANADPNLTSQIPKTRTDQYELLFGNNHSLWQFLPDASNDNDPNTFSGGGMVLRFASGGGEVAYYDFDNATSVSKREIADKSFIVSDSINKLNWKLTDETKTILTYTARKAITQKVQMRNRMTMENGVMKTEQVSDTTNIIAWFTTDIPVPAGPGAYQGQLPGLILELDENKGQTVFKAIEVSPKVSIGKIKEPKDGKKLTAAEFAKEREKILEEMRKNAPNGMQFRIQN